MELLYHKQGNTEIHDNSKLHAKARKATEKKKHTDILRHRAGQDKGFMQRAQPEGPGTSQAERMVPDSEQIIRNDLASKAMMRD